MLESGAFSDGNVVKAVSDFVPVLVKGDRKVEARYGGIHGYPTVFFADGDEKVLLEIGDRSPEAVVKQMREALDKAHPDIPWVETPEAAAEKAKGTDGKAGLLQLLVFVDGKETSEKLLKAFRSKDVISVADRVVFAKLSYAKDAPGVDAHKVKQAATVVLLDADGKEIDRSTSFKDTKGIAAFLKKQLDKKPAPKAK